MADETARGRFVWHELLTPNGAGAQAFYSKTLGWGTEPWDRDSSYTLFTAAVGPIGGVGEQSGDKTPCWIPYIVVPEVDEAARRATELGASIRTGTTQMEGGGKHASLVDPHGGVFGVYSTPEPIPEADPGPGEFSWHELATTDYAAAFEFYSALFGWEKVAEHDMGPMGVYLLFGRNGKQIGGMFNKGDMGKPGPAYWVSYVRIKDIDAVVSRAQTERGSVVAGPMDVPGGDRIAQIVDPYGALFAVHVLAEDLAAEGTSAAAKPAEQGQAAITSVWEKPAKEKAAKEKAGRKETAREEAATEKPATQNGAKKKSTKKKSAKKKSANAKPPTKKGVTKKAAKKKTAKKKAAKKKLAKKKAATKKAATRKAAKKTGKRTGTKKPGQKKPGQKKPGRKKAGKKAAGKMTKKKAKKKAKKAARKKSRGASAKKKPQRKKSGQKRSSKKRGKRQR